MSRDQLLQQRKEKEAALKEISEKYKDPAGIKYDLFDESGNLSGHVEYSPVGDMVTIRTGSSATIDGKYLKSVRDVLNKILDE